MLPPLPLNSRLPSQSGHLYGNNPTIKGNANIASLLPGYQPGGGTYQQQQPHYKTPQYVKSLNSKQLIANQILGGGVPTTSLTGSNGQRPSRDDKHHLNQSLNGNQMSPLQSGACYSVLPTRMMHKGPSQIPKPHHRYEEFDQLGKHKAQNDYFLNLANEYKLPHSQQQSISMPCDQKKTQERASSVVREGAKKVTASRYSSDEPLQQKYRYQYQTLQPSQAPTMNRQGIPSKSSKISQSAIEILRNNPVSSTQHINQTNLPKLQPAKVSLKPYGYVMSYAANTHNGLARNYNEDRISIVMDLKRPGAYHQRQQISFFAIFDGHGGSGCAEFLRDRLHIYVAQQECFPSNPTLALKQGFKVAEDEFMKQNQRVIKDKSGTCACAVLIVDDQVFIANVGDSRAIMSMNNGQKSVELSKDHKPSDESEKKRILENGGQVYQNNQILNSTVHVQENAGPVRVLPGRLSVCRTFGDPLAKLESVGGNPKVVIATPEIQSFRLSDSVHDFILICCDGVFDRLSTDEVIEEAWAFNSKNHNQPQASNPSQSQIQSQSQSMLNDICGQSVDRVMRTSMIKESLDNLSVVMISFKNFQKYIENMLQKPQGSLQGSGNYDNRSSNLAKSDAGRLLMQGGPNYSHHKNKTVDTKNFKY